ncbi:MAG: DnaJ domain-containing protein [Candidatus Taylorbacteria bacterium]|nr:DnaJ domain-containing protein [Candidatus Taylorbacteria bacterium]
MKDYYKTLGIEKTASKDEIKVAFRKMAHQYHPDKNKGNEEASKKFKEASEAYSTLSDDNKRKQYDMFGANGPAGGAGAGGFNGGQGFGGFQGFNNGQGFNFDFSNVGGGGAGSPFNGQGMEFDIGDVFGEFFGGGRRRPRKGATITVDVQIPFKESIFGVEKEISIGGREKLLVKIPPGIENGQGLRVAGKGENGEGGHGDLIVRVWVHEDPVFHKEGTNLIMELSIKLTASLLGGIVEVDTLDGKIELKIPQGTIHGEILRLKNKGVPDGRGRRGDLLIVIKVNIPKRFSKEAQRAVEELKREGL